MLKPARHRNRSMDGFTLVELLVGMAVGIIVIGAAVAFIVSSVRANSENLRSIRLTQELRALTELVGREIRRSRHVASPDLLAAIGQNPLPASVMQYNGVLVRDNGDTDCIEFSYFIPDDNDPNTDFRPGRIIWLENARINVARYPNTDIPASLTDFCAGAPPGTAEPVSSAEVRITAFNLDGSDATCFSTDPTVNVNCNAINLRIEGRLGTGADEIVRTFGQRIRIRSSANPPPPPPSP